MFRELELPSNPAGGRGKGNERHQTIKGDSLLLFAMFKYKEINSLFYLSLLVSVIQVGNQGL